MDWSLVLLVVVIGGVCLGAWQLADRVSPNVRGGKDWRTEEFRKPDGLKEAPLPPSSGVSAEAQRLAKMAEQADDLTRNGPRL